MNTLIPVAIAGGGIAYILAKQDGIPQLPGCTQYQTGTGASTINDLANGVPCGGGGYYSPLTDNSGQAGFSPYGGIKADPDARQKLDLLNQAMEAGYSKMNSAAKSAAADQLNQQLALDPPLKGNEDWQTVSRVAGGAAGAVGCTAVGLGSAAPLCSMAGAYLGVKLEDWMASELPGLKSWVSDNVGAVIDAIGDQLTEWWNDIF